MKTNLLKKLAVAFLCFWATTYLAPAQWVQKVTDLVTGQDQNGIGNGASVPECRFTPIGTNLWFTSNAGGAAGAGGVFILDPSTSNITQVATLDNNTGKSPWASSLMVANGQGWFTASAGGAGAKGALCSINLTNYAVSNAFSFPTNASSGWNPHSTPVQIGDDLWFTTSSGGNAADGSTTYGALVKYNLTSGLLVNMFSLDSTNSGRQPLGNSLVKAGNAWYFFTFAGGTNNVFGAPNGAGVLNKLAFDNLNQPTLSKAADLPSKFLAFPPGDPVFDGTNYLYFMTTGVSTNPGAIGRFDLTSGAVTSLFNFVTNAAATTNFGKQPYCTPVLYNNELYFTTLSGGTAGKGILGKLSLSNNMVTKLADFEGATNLALGASPQYNSGTVYTNPTDGRIGIYFPINRGGLNNNNGTILRVLMPPPPIIASLQSFGNDNLQLSWTGGYPPFQVDARLSSFSRDWTTNWLENLTTNTVTLSATNREAYFRVLGAAQ